MIALPVALAHAAQQAGIKTPENPDAFDSDDNRENFAHFFVYCAMQLGASQPYPGCHFENAKLIAELSEAEVKKITYEQLIEKGFAVGCSKI